MKYKLEFLLFLPALPSILSSPLLTQEDHNNTGAERAPLNFRR